jgi:hypothetical protein
MQAMTAGRVLILVAVIPLLAGCGGGGTSDRTQVLDTIRDSVTARDRGDWAAQCALLSPRARAARVAGTRVLQTRPGWRDFVRYRTPLAHTCAEALKAVGYRGNQPGLAAQPGAFDRLQDARVSVDGERATASRLSLPQSAPTELRLVRIDGHWLIDQPAL